MDHRGDDDTLQVCELFRSLQGETSWSGLPATFLRLSGCNLDCRYCDSRYAREQGEPWALEDLVERLVARPELVVVTGGEPLLQPGVHRLLSAVADAGRTVLCETNGSLDISGVDERVIRIVDVKCPGSGEAASTRWENLSALRPSDEVKFVVSDRQDFRYAMDVVARHRLTEQCSVLLSPVADALAATELAAELAAWILEEGGPLRLQLQLHRILWPDRPRGA
ncbi:MAG: radical SAM protein [bacterium]